MFIKKEQEDKKVTLSVVGRLDTETAPQFDEEFKNVDQDVTELVVNMGQLEYVSSAGLRALLAAHKAMAKRGGSMVVTNVGEVVNEVFEVTGFSDILTIQ